MRLAGALAALLGDVEVYEEQLVAMLGLAKVERLWRDGLITHPSPLLGRLLEEMPGFLAAEVLSRLDPVTRTMIAQVGRPWRAAVVASGLPRANGFVRLRLREFCARSHFSTSSCPPFAAAEHVPSSHGHPCFHAHRSTSNCPFSAAPCTYPHPTDSRAPAPTSAHARARSMQLAHMYSFPMDSRARAPTAAPPGSGPERCARMSTRPTGTRSPWPKLALALTGWRGPR